MSEDNKETNHKDSHKEHQKEGPKDAKPESELDKVKAELEKSKKDYLYLLADFDNYRKNSIKERSDLSKFGAEKFVREFLTVFDNFERALESEVTSENLDSFRTGVKMISGELRSLLQRFGVEEIKAEGLAFDPNKHEALSSEPRGDMPAGHVSRVFQKAYKMHDRLLRPARVVVSTGETKPEAN